MGYSKTDASMMSGVRSRVCAGVGLSALLAGLASPTLVQAQAAAAKAAAVEEVVVTGSRIRGVAPVGANVVAIDEKAIKDTTGGSVTEILKTVPQISQVGISPESGRTPAGIVNTQRASAIDLRGLGPDATLPLFDSRRLVRNGVTAAYTDPNSLPVAFIGRVEVVPDGGSAIYGSSAIAGVVNIMPRKRFDGLEVAVKLGAADGWDTEQYSVIGGINWSTGNFVGSFEYDENSALNGTERPDIYLQNQTGRGGRDYRVFTCNPGNLVIGGVRYAIPASGPVTPASLVANTANKCDIFAPTDILAKEYRLTTAFYLTQELGDRLDFFLEGFAVRRKTNTPQLQSGSQLLTFSAALPRTNAFFVNPAGASTTAPVTLEYLFDQKNYPGYLNQQGRNIVVQVETGITAKLWYDWKAELAAVYGRGKEEYYDNNLNDAARVLAWADTNPATAFNPFGQTPAPTLAAIKTFRFAPWAWNTLTNYALHLDGPLFDLPAGTIRAAVGLEYTKDVLKGGATRGTLTVPVIGVITNVNQAVKTAFGEVLIPVVGSENAVPLIQRLDVSLAGRIDKYEDVGTTKNPKYGFNWTVLDGVIVHGTYGTSFRAPQAGQNQPLQVIAAGIYPQTLTDTNGTQVTGLLIRGGNPDIQPESAKTYSLGVEFAPKSMPLHLSATWWKINWTDRITAVAPSTTIQPLIQPEYAYLVTRNPSQALIDSYLNSTLPRAGAIPTSITFIVDSRVRNVGTLLTQGYDLLGSYMWADTPLGDIDLLGSAQITTEYKTQTGTGSPIQDKLNFIGTPPKFRSRVQAGLTHGPWRGTVSANYYNKYKNTTITPVPQTVDSNTTVDLHIGYTFEGGEKWTTQGLELALDVSNLFDKAPPFVDVAGGYDPGAASILGRYATVSLRKRF